MVRIYTNLQNTWVIVGQWKNSWNFSGGWEREGMSFITAEFYSHILIMKIINLWYAYTRNSSSYMYRFVFHENACILKLLKSSEEIYVEKINIIEMWRRKLTLCGKSEISIAKITLQEMKNYTPFTKLSEDRLEILKIDATRIFLLPQCSQLS